MDEQDFQKMLARIRRIMTLIEISTGDAVALRDYSNRLKPRMSDWEEKDREFFGQLVRRVIIDAIALENAAGGFAGADEIAMEIAGLEFKDE